MLKQLKELMILIDAATIDGESFRGYGEKHNPIVCEVKSITGIDISTPDGRQTMIDNLATPKTRRQIRYNTTGIGKGCYAAMIRYLFNTI